MTTIKSQILEAQRTERSINSNNENLYFHISQIVENKTNENKNQGRLPIRKHVSTKKAEETSQNIEKLSRFRILYPPQLCLKSQGETKNFLNTENL